MSKIKRDETLNPNQQAAANEGLGANSARSVQMTTDSCGKGSEVAASQSTIARSKRRPQAAREL
jgi:hypothetical protein